MGLFDSLKTRVKKGTDTVIDTTAKVGTFMEEKSATLMEKVPGGHDLKEKAAAYTEKAVDRVGTETKEMIKEGQGFIDSHMKKSDNSTEAKAAVVPPVAAAPETTIPVAAVVAPVVETHETIDTSTEKVEHHTHKKVVEKKAHTTKKSHTNTKK